MKVIKPIIFTTKMILAQYQKLILVKNKIQGVIDFLKSDDIKK